MILKKDLLRVEFGSMKITHNGTEADVGYGRSGPLIPKETAKLVFDSTAIEGLEDVPGFRRNKTERPISHGSFLEKGRAEPRVIALTGHAFAVNASTLHKLRSSLAKHLNTGGFRQFKFDFAGGTRYAIGSCDSGLTWTQELDHYARWKFDIYCPDPRLYGNWKEYTMRSLDVDRTGYDFISTYPAVFTRELELPKRPTLQNLGNSEAYPVFELDANTSGFKITNGAGKSIVFSGTTRRGTLVSIDTFTGRATVGGSDQSYSLSTRNWFSVPAEGSIKPTVDFVASPNVEANLSMRVKLRDTWI